MRRTALFLTVLLAAPFLNLAAQAPVCPTVGGLIRVKTDPGSPWLAGTLVAADANSLRLCVADTSVVSVSRRSIAQLEVWSRHSNMGKGAGVGLLVGGMTGAIAGLLSGDDRQGFIRFTAGEKALGLGLLGVVTGGLVGATIGSSSHVEGWEPASPRRLHLALAARSGDLALSLAF